MLGGVIVSYSVITAGISTPKEGIFWFINDGLIVFSENIDIHSFEMGPSGGLLHKQVWESIKSKYPVKGQQVKYDYYPRGRVMITPNIDDDGNFTNFYCTVYADPCIMDNSDIHDKIINEFRLYHKSCIVEFEGDLSIDGTHYSCHQCRF
jgi:hypothetical protein